MKEKPKSDDSSVLWNKDSSPLLTFYLHVKPLSQCVNDAQDGY